MTISFITLISVDWLVLKQAFRSSFVRRNLILITFFIYILFLVIHL